MAAEKSALRKLKGIFFFTCSGNMYISSYSSKKYIYNLRLVQTSLGVMVISMIKYLPNGTT